MTAIDQHDIRILGALAVERKNEWSSGGRARVGVETPIVIMLLGDDLDSRIRAAAMTWLRQRCTPEDPVVRRDELLKFQFEGRTFALIDNHSASASLGS